MRFGNLLRFSLLNHVKRSLSSRPKLCIIGSGPSAFYTAQFILKNHDNVQVDMFEKLPAPFGLVRYGVAPDHPEVKNVINTFTEVAKNPRFSFLGNVVIGRDLNLKELQKAYTAIVWAYGATVDRRLNIPGENLQGVISAKEFVGWYNGAPNNVNLHPDLSCETVALIGMGNVALDIARILLSPIDRLKCTDIPEPVMNCLSKSRVRKVVLIGRRGPLQVAFTLKELRELTKLQICTNSSCSIKISPSDIFGITIGNDEQIYKLIQDLPRPRRRLTEFLYKLSESVNPVDQEYVCEFRFLRFPIEILSDSNRTLVSHIKLGATKLDGPIGPNQHSIPDPDVDSEILKCGLVIRSIGYRGVCIDPDLPFDEKLGVIKCKDSKGRVMDLPPDLFDFPISPMYCTGWIKRGPVGVILDSAMDARETAKTIVTDLVQLETSNDQNLLTKQGFDLIKHYLDKRGVSPITFDKWERVDQMEKLAGKSLGKPREKFTTIQTILNAAFHEIYEHKLNNSQ